MRRLILPLIFGIAGTLVLLGLGTWQVQRLDWKQGVLAEIDARIAAAPGALPETVTEAEDKYRPVTATGQIGADEILVQSSMKLVGPGFRVIVPFETGGQRILLDRGFIRLSDRDKDRAPKTVTVTGNLHWPDEVDGFTPDPDPEKGFWYARDIPSMAAHLDTAPVLLVARETDESPLEVTPLPVDTAGIPNNHLNYAITWFLLAIVWVAMTVFFVISQRRPTKKD